MEAQLGRVSRPSKQAAVWLEAKRTGEGKLNCTTPERLPQ